MERQEYIPPALEIIESGFEGRITDPGSYDDCSYDQAARVVSSWQDRGMKVIYGLGGFDNLHNNHVVGLTRCRVLGAMAVLGIEQVTTEPERKEVQLTAANMTRMIISVDTDAALAKGKSRNIEKGGAPKPTLQWGNRARGVAMQTMPLPDSNLQVPLADFITCHGAGSCACCEELGYAEYCPTRRHRYNILALQPDFVVVRHDLSSIPKLLAEKDQGNLPNTEFLFFNERLGSYGDLYLSGDISATAIATRIRS
jgi:hypothetical protein